MSKYLLTVSASKDIEEVIYYTASVWGRDATIKYVGGLKEMFSKIESGTVIKRVFDESIPEILVAKYRFHFVFYKHEPQSIIGVLHERRDIINILNERIKQ